MVYVYCFLGFVIIWAIWQASRPRAIFTVRLNEGNPAAISSTVTVAFLERLREVAAHHHLTRGEVRGVVDKQNIRLKFSADFPEPARQQLRNWWMIHGWPAPRDNRST